MIGFVLICTDQKQVCADTNFVREALLTALLSCPQIGWESQCTAWGGVTGKSKHSTLMKHSSWLTSQLRGLIKVREGRKKNPLPSLSSGTHPCSKFADVFQLHLNICSTEKSKMVATNATYLYSIVGMSKWINDRWPDVNDGHIQQVIYWAAAARAPPPIPCPPLAFINSSPSLLWLD